MHDITKDLDAITGGDRPALFPLGLVQTTPEALRALVASHGDVRGDADDPAALAQPCLTLHQCARMADAHRAGESGAGSP